MLGCSSPVEEVRTPFEDIHAARDAYSNGNSYEARELINKVRVQLALVPDVVKELDHLEAAVLTKEADKDNFNLSAEVVMHYQKP